MISKEPGLTYTFESEKIYNCMKKILIDFVAGTHGNFLEVVLNKGFGFDSDLRDSFTSLGTSHKKSLAYNNSKMFHAYHWSQRQDSSLSTAEKIISIRFSKKDLLLVSSISLLRTNDMAIDNDQLECNTFEKLNNKFYHNTLQQIQLAYPKLKVDQKNCSIPRNILREFYKFGFKNPEDNGYWLKLQELVYPDNKKIIYFDFCDFYSQNQFIQALKKVEEFVELKFNFDESLLDLHAKFLSLNSYISHKSQCDQIVFYIQQRLHKDIPKLTLFQESYINACLENIYKKEMPFHDLTYFTSTKDVLKYIETQAPLL